MPKSMFVKPEEVRKSQFIKIKDIPINQYKSNFHQELEKFGEKKLTQIGKVELQLKHCIVESEGTACGSCSEHCPTQAVKMVPYKDDLTIPETDQTICIGCGACEYACPVVDPHPAIFVVSNAEHVLAEEPKTEKIESAKTTQQITQNLSKIFYVF